PAFDVRDPHLALRNGSIKRLCSDLGSHTHANGVAVMGSCRGSERHRCAISISKKMGSRGGMANTADGEALESRLKIEHDPCWGMVARVSLPTRPSVNTTVHQAV